MTIRTRTQAQRDAINVRTCRGCGCDDNHACITDDGPCAWVLLDIGTPTGFCSECAHEVGWDVRVMNTWNREEPEVA